MLSLQRVLQTREVHGKLENWQHKLCYSKQRYAEYRELYITTITITTTTTTTTKNNYRPISILLIPGTVTEKCVSLTYLWENLHNILNIWECSFRKYHSTVRTIAELTLLVTGNIFNNINYKYVTGATFINFIKIFDTVNYVILKQKLKRMDITGKALEWVP